ncbi:metalloendopeptidase OMA1, mitochondrial [Patella vulgata]|uniref:metalloendopeptidase OMA1, mitochondrial n=1 Tax=Patella vulgata TaxID=6465 RepID=UPI0024A9DEF7|nr:metalloendopeptidase OMA1, mitochondrial [Patella vulgata]
MEKYGCVSFSGLSLYYCKHLQETPITGRRRFIAFTPAQYEKLSYETYKHVLHQYEKEFLNEDHPYHTRLTRVFHNLLWANRDFVQLNSNQKWEYRVLDRPYPKYHINALCVEHGLILVNSSALEVLQTDDELAFIIAHEMAHILLGHQQENISQGQLLDFMIIAVMAAIWTMIPNDGISIVTHWFFGKCRELFVDLPYSRKVETEADKVGLEIMAKACYDIRAAPVTMTKLSIDNNLNESGKFQMEFLKTHPLSTKRAEHMNHLLPWAELVRKSCDCPELPSKDPRELIAFISYLAEQRYLKLKTRQNLKQVTYKL